MGVLSAMPVLSLGNCLLCLWVWVGGALAVFLYARMEQKPLSTGDGAIIGAAAGLVGAIIFSALWLVLGAAALGVLSALGETSGDETLALLAMGSAGIAIRFVFALVLGPAIGALAGLVGVELFGKASPPTPLG
jgi:Na+/H+-dicarboxylate symporter